MIRDIESHILVGQRISNSCGKVCLCVCARRLGKQISPKDERFNTRAPRSRSSIAEIAQWTKLAGLSSDPFYCIPSRVADIPCPAILHFHSLHFVALLAAQADHAILADPSVGIVTLANDALEDNFSGFGLAIKHSQGEI